MSDAAAVVDEFVGGLAADVRPPGIRRRNAVLVTGPWLAGISSVAAVLRECVPDVEILEADGKLSKSKADELRQRAKVENEAREAGVEVVQPCHPAAVDRPRERRPRRHVLTTRARGARSCRQRFTSRR